MSGYALAIDLGTTTLAASLVDLNGRRRLAMAGSRNPQSAFGADVVSRLDAAVHSEHALTEMASLIRDELWRLSEEVCAAAGISRHEIAATSIAGNPAMQHILAGWPVRSLAYPPFRPLQTGGVRLASSDLGWSGNEPVYLFPMPGGFVGGDTVAFLYGQCSPCSQLHDPALYLDMGTNGEMALTAGDTIWATSAAAGPAFEGGNLTCGMAALPGAVSSVRLVDSRIKVEVIGNQPPAGLCGSAAIETVDLLLNEGLLEPSGRLKSSTEIASNLATRITEHNGENLFVIHRDARSLICLSQGDIRQIQLAKSAIRAGMEVMFERSCIHGEALKSVILTGSFGAVLQPQWLKSIGVFDESMIHSTRFTPEGALSGAEKALLAGDDFRSVEQLARRFRVVPLSGTPLFEEHFMRHMDFPR